MFVEIFLPMSTSTYINSLTSLLVGTCIYMKKNVMVLIYTVKKKVQCCKENDWLSGGFSIVILFSLLFFSFHCSPWPTSNEKKSKKEKDKDKEQE